MNLAEILCRFSLVYGRRCVYFQQTESVYLIWCSKMIWYYPTIGGITIGCLTLSWRGPLSYRNQSIELLCILMDWFLYDNGFCQERVNVVSKSSRLTHLLPLISYYTLTKYQKIRGFPVILHCVKYVNRPKLCGNCVYQQNFHTRKLGEIPVFLSGGSNTEWFNELHIGQGIWE